MLTTGPNLAVGHSTRGLRLQDGAGPAEEPPVVHWTSSLILVIRGTWKYSALVLQSHGFNYHYQVTTQIYMSAYSNLPLCI